jgi:hypothetical protein
MYWQHQMLWSTFYLSDNEYFHDMLHYLARKSGSWSVHRPSVSPWSTYQQTLYDSISGLLTLETLRDRKLTIHPI